MSKLENRTAPGTASSLDPSDGLEELLQLLMRKFERVCVELERVCDELSGRVKPYYSVDEVAEMTGRSAYTVRRWIGEGRIDATRIEGTGPKGRLLVAREELSKLVKLGLGTGIPAAATSVDERIKQP